MLGTDTPAFRHREYLPKLILYSLLTSTLNYDTVLRMVQSISENRLGFIDKCEYMGYDASWQVIHRRIHGMVYRLRHLCLI